MKTNKKLDYSVTYQLLAAIAIRLGVTVDYRDGHLTLRAVPRLVAGEIFDGTVEFADDVLTVHFPDADDGPVSTGETQFYFGVLASMFEIAYEADADVARMQIPPSIAGDADAVWELLGVALEVLSVMRAYAEEIALDRLLAAQEPPVQEPEEEPLDFELEAAFGEAGVLL